MHRPQNIDSFNELPPESDSSIFFDDKNYIRISTAPARPLTELEEFKRSTEFLLLEQAIFCSNNLVQKNLLKYDLDSADGHKYCKKYLGILERMCETYNVNTADRSYRENFSKAYKILYKEGNLCYLTEILDSAQEGFPYLWVNSEKFVFSNDVLESGMKLITSFARIQNVFRDSYTKLNQETLTVVVEQIKNDVMIALEKMDFEWANFEKLYVAELMIIEKNARRLITQAINMDKDLQLVEAREKLKGRILFHNEDYTNIRKKLIQTISEINAVANVEGKGRDDLNVSILLEAEGILRRVSKEQSKAARNIAEKIRNTFQNIRSLLRKYDENIEMVDPQLKNNQDLVELLNDYEKYWEKGKNYFLETKKCNFLIHFSHVIEATCEKYKEFNEKLDCREADIFLIIPCLLVLNFLDKDDKQICVYFLPQLISPTEKIHGLYSELQKDFTVWKSQHLRIYEYYNILEKYLIGVGFTDEEKRILEMKESNALIEKIIHNIKFISIQMERNNPTEWNNFLNAALF